MAENEYWELKQVVLRGDKQGPILQTNTAVGYARLCITGQYNR